MIIVLKKTATDEEIQHIQEKIAEWGLETHVSRGQERTIIGVIGDERVIKDKPLEVFPGVEQVMPVLKPYKLVSREFHPQGTRIEVGEDIVIGGERIIIMAGPCSVESEEHIMKMASLIKKAGGHILRGGAYKPRTSPYAFQGHGLEGLKWMARAREETGLAIVTEIMDVRHLDQLVEYADIIQVGARNMQNFVLLRELGKVNKPVLLKRGMSATFKELFMSAEYIASGGNTNILLCERGIRTFSDFTRNTADIGAIPVIRQETHLPIVFDPSHAAGNWKFVPSIAMAAVAAGADALIIEIHDNPEEALSDGAQSLIPDRFIRLLSDLDAVAVAVHRTIL